MTFLKLCSGLEPKSQSKTEWFNCCFKADTNYTCFKWWNNNKCLLLLLKGYIYIYRKWRHSPYEDRTQHAFNTYNNNKLINCNTESYIIVFKTNIKFIPDYFSTTVTFLYYCNNMSKTSNEHKLWNIYFLFVIHIERCFQLPTAKLH